MSRAHLRATFTVPFSRWSSADPQSRSEVGTGSGGSGSRVGPSFALNSGFEARVPVV
jgi:hypothetical protein